MRKQFIYNPKLKLGLAEINDDNTIEKIIFEDRVIFHEELNNVTGTFLNETIQDAIENNAYKYLFTPATIRKGNDLMVLEDTIKINKSQELEAKVESSYGYGDYKVTISGYPRLNTNCSCPVGYNCKHGYALLNKIQEIYQKRQLPVLNIYIDIIFQALTFSNFYPCIRQYDTFIQLRKVLNKLENKEEIEYLIKYFSKYRFQCDILYLLAVYLLYNPKKWLKELDNQYQEKIYEYQEEIKTREIDSNTMIDFIIVFFRNEYFYILHNFIYIYSRYKEDLDVDIIEDIFTKIDFSNPNYEEQIQALIESEIRFDTLPIRLFIKYVYPHLKTPDKIKLYLAYPKQIKLEEEILNSDNKKYLFKTFDKKTQKQLIKDYPSVEDQLFFINELIYKFKDDYIPMIEVEETFGLLETIPNFKFIYLFFLATCYDNRIKSDNIYEACKVANEINLDIINELFEFKAEEYSFNNREIEIEPFEKRFRFYYRMSLKTNDSTYYEFYGDKLFEELEYFTSFDNKNFKIIKSLFTTAILEATKEVRQNVIDKELAKYQEKMRKINQKAMMEYLNAYENQVVDDTIKELSVNNQNSLAHINLSINPKNNEVELKFGYNKLYKVRSVMNLLNAVKSENRYTVYKTVEYNGNFNSFDNQSKQIIEILLQNVYDYNSDDDSINSELPIINSVGLSKLIKTLNGLPINNEFYKLKDEIKVDLMIDKDYQVQTNPCLKNELVLDGDDENYYLSNIDYSIRRITSSEKLWSIIPFFIRFNNCSIEDNLEEFYDTIYLSNQEFIQIPDNLFNNVLDSKQEIEIYFDYEKDTIIRTLYVKEKGEIVDEKHFDEKTIKTLKKLDYVFNEINFTSDKITNEETIFNFLTCNLQALKKLCTVYLSDSLKNKHLVPFTKQKLRMNNESSVFDAFFESSIYSDEELEAIYNAVKKKKKYVVLKNNTIVDVNNEEAKEFFELTNDLKLDKKKLTTAQHISFYNVFKTLNYVEDENITDYFKQVIDEVKDYKNNKLNVKKLNLTNVTLKPYQIDGINWMNTLVKYNLSGILADDMGLGKTLQVIALLKNNKAGNSLIVCPKSLIFNWMNEFAKFAPDMKVEKIYGLSPDRTNTINLIKKDKNVIYLTSYDSLRNDLEVYEKAKIKFDYLVLDEAQIIKTVTTKKSIAVKQLQANHRFVLTGTPIENNVLELWSIFEFLMPGYLDNIDDFKKRFESDNMYKELIAKRIAMFILRRTKKEVLKELPDKFEKVVTAEMTNDQRKIYDSYCNEARNIFTTTGNVFSVLPMLLRLRQICVDPNLFVEDYHGESGKINLLIDDITNYLNDHHKILIFSQFVKGLNLLEEYFNQKQIKYYLLTGETKAEERINLCDQFNDQNNDVQVFLISLKAGGNGLNLTGADVVLHLDPWWNSAVQDQATDRAYRIGQTKNVEVIKYICEDSIEERVIELQNKKKDLIDSLISSDDNQNLSKLSYDDIKYILDI